jgi:class III poly(R)-hydroxyalkanoic acid synthase PhaE subunit
MSESNPWAGQWFKAQQQFVDAWSDMAKAGTAASNTSQSDMWAQSFDLWRKAIGGQSQPDIQQAISKCVDMGKEYFAMAEQISKSLSAGAKPVDAVNQWMEQLKQSLQQFGGMPGFDGTGVNDFMKQWFAPTSSWQQLASALTPMNQAAWQMPGMNTSVFNLGETVDPLGKILEAPGIGYFREPQEKQQKGLQLAMEYHQANQAFNQAFLRVAIESIQGFQARLMKLDQESMPKSLRGLYDLWVEVSEEHYAEFAMSEEYQSLYGDMVNRLMIMKKHYAEIMDDTLRAMNLPNTREVDTMQARLQQLRRENIVLKKEVGEIRTMLQQGAAKPAVAAKPAPVVAAEPAPIAPAQPAPEVSLKPAAAVKKAPIRAAVKKAPARKAAAKKAPAKKQPAVTEAKKGA